MLNAWTGLLQNACERLFKPIHASDWQSTSDLPTTSTVSPGILNHTKTFDQNDRYKPLINTERPPISGRLNSISELKTHIKTVNFLDFYIAPRCQAVTYWLISIIYYVSISVIFN